MKLYGDFLSGNCYKIKLLAAVLEIELDWIHIDILAGETRTPEFLKRTRQRRSQFWNVTTGGTYPSQMRF
jgi:glutathione S-transferase